jgi:hypothetical protein
MVGVARELHERAAAIAGPVGGGSKDAVTVRSCDMSTTHWLLPVQAPVHPENVDAPLGVATSATAELLG